MVRALTNRWRHIGQVYISLQVISEYWITVKFWYCMGGLSFNFSIVHKRALYTSSPWIHWVSASVGSLYSGPFHLQYALASTGQSNGHHRWHDTWNIILCNNSYCTDTHSLILCPSTPITGSVTRYIAVWVGSKNTATTWLATIITHPEDRLDAWPDDTSPTSSLK